MESKIKTIIETLEKEREYCEAQAKEIHDAYSFMKGYYDGKASAYAGVITWLSTSYEKE